MDHLRGAARGADGVVAALDQRHRVAARGRVERHAGAGDPAADHDDLEAPPGDRLDRLGPRDHRRPAHQSRNSAPGRRAGARAGLLLDRPPSGAGRRSARRRRGRPRRGPPAAQHPGRPPVAGEPAGVGGEQDDVGGDRGRVQVLLVLDRVAARARRRRRPGSAPGRASARPRGPPPPSGSERRGPRTRKRQGAVRWWLGAQRASSSSSSSSSRVERLGPERLVGAAGADRRLDIHALTESAHHQPKRRPRNRTPPRARAPMQRDYARGCGPEGRSFARDRRPRRCAGWRPRPLPAVLGRRFSW